MTLGEIIEENGGIEALLDKWSKCRSFPWYPDGFVQRSERNQYRLSMIRYPEFDEEEIDEDVIAIFSAECHEANRKRELEHVRYSRILRADDEDVFDFLSHDEFCDTAYWIGLACWMKHRASMQCADCRQHFGTLGELQVHHRTYAHRGREYPDHLADLVVLCARCHARRHGK